ncbi:MAG: hypothetical protein A3F10_00855 [Coxiella sp. RIFCSPHIGHO2_12_FULL_42_15]|nr:MAG: hypothetical protein A3F10_00855 [Coxiella sp. RIFCSPHIGHO2_12_FULL_42_15]
MGIWTHFRESMLNILSAKLRSILAILGILVGTGAVVALITSSQLATTHALAQFKTLGTHLVSINISYQGSGVDTTSSTGLTLDQVYQLANSIPGIEKMAPYASIFQTILYQGQTFQGSVAGVTRDFFNVAKVRLSSGRMVSIFDKTKLYAVIGHKMAKQLRGMGVMDPIGKQITVGNWFVTIVGVAKPWQPNLFVFLSLNEGMLVPIEAASLLAPSTTISNLLIKLTPEANLQKTQAVIQQTLQNMFPTAVINVQNPQQILDLIKKQQATFTWLLAAIGGISLLVGGIGVMNIMLVSVVERRREIGIRLAIGAYQSDILIMFLIESVMLTLFGGVLGIIIGLTFSYVLAYLSHWEFYFFLLPPVLGFVVSVFVGIVSGFYPALRASRLDPIQSLQAN